jgi:hypothetical protein
MPQPLALSDAAITTIMGYSRPLHVADRDAFVRDVAAVLATQAEIGDGVLSRVCRAMQARYLRPLDLSQSKYS